MSKVIILSPIAENRKGTFEKTLELLRKDGYSKVIIDDEQYEGLAPYKSLMKSKFAVLYIEPFPGGGTFIDIVFLDNPRIVFKSWVYSFISEKTVVDGYEVRHCERYDEEIDLTKEEILKIIEEKPLNKLW